MGTSQRNDHAAADTLALLRQEEEELPALDTHCAHAGYPIQLYGEGRYYHRSGICTSHAALYRQDPYEFNTGSRRHHWCCTGVLYDLHGDSSSG
ncbi:MAG: Rieske 2Fe-2S domain-containing protein [Prevotella sp.]|nr:Rieske 2Fe-2S domain-containing protein [Prevotella sp.]MBR0262563.1 Rieske 2Fe-2S domain-containing protein [Prevotella sp.]